MTKFNPQTDDIQVWLRDLRSRLGSSGRQPRMPKVVKDWTTEEIKTLCKLWADDTLSAAEIGRRMGRSKGSIVGKVDRLDLPARDAAVVRHNAAYRKRLA